MKIKRNPHVKDWEIKSVTSVSKPNKTESGYYQVSFMYIAKDDLREYHASRIFDTKERAVKWIKYLKSKQTEKNPCWKSGSQRRFMYSKGIVKKNPLQKNPPTLIYDRVIEIRAMKGNTSNWANTPFKHSFTGNTKAQLFGLPDGSLLIKGNKRLWKTFDYGK